MIQQPLTIARNTFVESIRQPIFFVLVMLSGVLLFFTTWSTAFQMGYSNTAEVHGDDAQLLQLGLATVFLFGMLLAAFVATSVVSREIENRTVLTVVSKPIGRPALVLGKFIGVAAAILLALVIMLSWVLLCIRHGVMTTAADDPDGPVLLFGLLGIAAAVGAGIVCNYLYGWHFSQTAMLVLAPLAALAYLLVLVIGKRWNLQPLHQDFKPQVVTACLVLSLAVLVLTAVATAVSTRLGQVMTIVVCAGVFVLGLLSNYLLGTRAFSNQAVGRVEHASSPVVTEAAFDTLGSTYSVTLMLAANSQLRPGMPFYYGPTPNGFPLAVPRFSPYTGDVGREDALFAQGTPPALVVTAVNGRTITVRNVGEEPVKVPRPPEKDDYVFPAATRINPVFLTLWGLTPNMHFFYLSDAVTQNRPVPASYLALVGAYGVVQIGAWLALGIVLFQKRDVG